MKTRINPITTAVFIHPRRLHNGVRWPSSPIDQQGRLISSSPPQRNITSDLLKKKIKNVLSLTLQRRNYTSRLYGDEQVESFGQPLPMTHPHLLQPEEVTIGISSQEYADRRAKLMASLPAGCAVIIAGARTKWMAHHVFYPFRQSSDFWYLTGFQEPDACLLLEKDDSAKGYTMTMFVRPKDALQEMWEGARSGIDGAKKWFAADQAFDISELAHRLKPILTKSTKSPVFLDLPTDIEFSTVAQWRTPRVPLIDFFSKNNSQAGDLVESLSVSTRDSNMRSCSNSKHDLDSCLAVLGTARATNRAINNASHSKYRPIKSLQAKLDPIKMIKSDAELKLLRIASDISAHGFKAAMRLAAECTPERMISEHDLVQTFESTCHKSSPGIGGRMGYVPVCAAGPAALTIHYTANDRMLKAGKQMVLLDAGFEYGGYVADITRTFPVGGQGKFTSAQKDLYEVVKNVENELIDQCSESNRHSLSSLHRLSCQLLKDQLVRLGFNLDHPDALHRLYPHYIGHPVGTDLHDTPSWDRSLRLKSGSVITIEPGVYVPNEDRYPKHFRGIGIRVEDMVQVREDDQVILSVNTPKEVADIEACASGLLDHIK